MESGDGKNQAFHLVILHAVAGGSVFVALHEIDALLAIASGAAVLGFLTLAVSALACALVALAMRESSRAGRLINASVALLVLGYALLIAGGWYRFITDPEMFQDGVESAVFKA
jgi:apolipoprotein N-acyltransferase